MLAQRNFNSTVTEEAEVSPEEMPPEREAPASAEAGDGERGAGPAPSQASRKSIEEYTPLEIGREGENLAASFLERRGYEIISRNWRCEFGEADIVARDHDEAEVVLVEVKTRVALGDGEDLMPELAVNRRKQTRYKKIALFYIAAHPELISVRFDVIAVSIVGYHSAKIRHLQCAYAWDENR